MDNFGKLKYLERKNKALNIQKIKFLKRLNNMEQAINDIVFDDFDYKFDTLYARNSKGGIKKWRIAVQEKGGYGRILIEHGDLKTNHLVQHIDVIKHGKSIGKANQTTPYTQALKEARARQVANVRIGYKTLDDLNLNSEDYDEIMKALPISNTDGDDNLIPMKCQKYYKPKVKDGVAIQVPTIKFPCLGQPKLNGIRCFVKWRNGKAVFFSKKGLEYPILTHIGNYFREDMFEHEGIELVYDGEIYCHGMILSDIISAARTFQLTTLTLKYYSFDLAISGYLQEQRLDILAKKFARFGDIPETVGDFDNKVVLVSTTNISSHEQAQEFAKECVKLGYEGAIFRTANVEYGFGKRPPTITKMKFYIEMEFKIVDVIPFDKDQDQGKFVCEYKSKEFEVVPEGNREVRREYLMNKKAYIGKMLTTKFYEWTVNNVPFHATGIAVRDYE
jgi:hypothetical protein